MKDKKIILVIVAAALIIAGVAVYYFTNSSKKDAIAGNYNCKPYSSGKEGSNYIVSLQLNKDKTFIYGPYEELDDNHYKGTYTYEKEDKNANNMDYYMISFKGTEYMSDGKSYDNHDFNAKMEFAMARGKEKREGVIIFTASYNMYYCYEE